MNQKRKKKSEKLDSSFNSIQFKMKAHNGAHRASGFHLIPIQLTCHSQVGSGLNDLRSSPSHRAEISLRLESFLPGWGEMHFHTWRRKARRNTNIGAPFMVIASYIARLM
jgi:hypothetical protein